VHFDVFLLIRVGVESRTILSSCDSRLSVRKQAGSDGSQSSPCD